MCVIMVQVQYSGERCFIIISAHNQVKKTYLKNYVTIPTII